LDEEVENMRANQVEITIRRFGDEVPKSYHHDQQIISVYADSNNLYEALSVAYSEVIKELQKYESVPSFGRVDVSNNHNNERLR
jgi:hypothetical protein